MRSFIAAHRLAFGAVAAIAAAGIAFVFFYFEPQALFIDKRVDEPLPALASDQDVQAEGSRAGGEKRDAREPAIQTVASGTFSSYEHSTSGRARVLRLADGTRFLRLDRFETSNGPDVRVFLSAAPVGGPGDAFDDDYVELGGLKGNIGDQNYEIPADVQLGRFQSVVIWCERFSVAFGAAPLS